MMFSRCFRALILFFLAYLFLTSEAQAQRITYRTRDIAGGFNVPWEMRFAPDGWLFFTERPGRISKLNIQTGERKILADVKDCVLWHEAGMLGFDFHPQFPDTPYIYLAFVYQAQQGVRSFGIFRYTYTGDSLVNRVQIFGPALAHWSHNGSRVVVHEGKLFFSLGEVWQFEIAQDKAIANGKINRINLDGSIPDDNPFPGLPAWSVGHRNPQGLDFAPDGTLYSSEHGDLTDDEINIIEKGRNYGWPLVQGYCDSASDHPNCEDLNIREPLAAFTPTLAASDITYFDQQDYPEWRNSLLLASLRDEGLHQFSLSDDGKQIMSWERYWLSDSTEEHYGRLRSICLSKDGRIFISTGNSYLADEHTDRIFELVRTGVEPATVTLVQPFWDAYVSAQDVPLTWRRSYYRAKYQIQLALSGEFDSMSILYTHDLEDTLVHVGPLTVGQRYFWRVRETFTNGPWSEVRWFVNAKSSVDENITPAREEFDVVSHIRTIRLLPKTGIAYATVEVIDALGRKRETLSLSDLHSGSEKSLGSFEPGVYFVRLTSANGVSTRRALVR
jgi:aldose sugar dehydrogenase